MTRKLFSSAAMVEVIAVLNVLRTLSDVRGAEIATCDGGNGQLVFERIPGFQLQGYDQDQASKTVLPIELLQDCQRACLKDLTIQNNLLRPCGSVDFHPGEPYGDGQYDSSMCYLTEERSKPDGIGTLVRVPGYIHFNKVCMPAQAVSSRCAERLYVFERHPEKSFTPTGNNCTQHQVGDRLECERMCLSAEQMVCRSATYTATNGTCTMCPITWRSVPAMFKDSASDEYIENMCLEKSRRCGQSDHLVFVEETERTLHTPNKPLHYRDVTIEQCKTKCVESTQILCRALEYRHKNGSSGDCYLLEDDSASVSQRSRTDDSRQDTTLMELMCLDHVISQYRGISGTGAGGRIRGGQARFSSRDRQAQGNIRNSIRNDKDPFFSREGLHREAGREYVTAFRRYSNKRLEGAQVIAQVPNMSSQMCMLACLQSRGCKSMTYSKRFGNCELYYQQALEKGARLVFHEDYDYYENLLNNVQGGLSRNVRPLPRRQQRYQDRLSGGLRNRWPLRFRGYYRDRYRGSGFQNAVGFSANSGFQSTAVGGQRVSGGGFSSGRPTSLAVGGQRFGGAGQFGSSQLGSNRFGTFSGGSGGQFGNTGGFSNGVSGSNFGGATFSDFNSGRFNGGSFNSDSSVGGSSGASFQNTGQFTGGAFGGSGARFPSRDPGAADCYDDRFALEETGRRLRSNLVTNVISVSSLSQCEDECIRSSTFICKALSYRYSSSSSSSASLDNCELSSHSLDEARSGDSPYEMDRDYDFYRRVRSRSCSGGSSPAPGAATGASSSSAFNTAVGGSFGGFQSSKGGFSTSVSGSQGSFGGGSGGLAGISGGNSFVRPVGGVISGGGGFPSASGIGGSSGGGVFPGGAGGVSEGGFISTDGGDVTASCDENGMELTLAANAPFYGRIYTFRHYDQCSVVGRGERIISLRITSDGNFPACGTQRFGDVMQNIVVVQFSEFVQTRFDKRYNLTCYFQGPGEAVVTSGYISASPGQLTPIIDLPAREVLDSRVRLSILYDGRPTTTIAVGDPLLFRLETQTGANLVSDIFASNVIARDPYSGRSVQLIDQFGCPTDPRLFPGLELSREGNGLSARFNAFKIPQSNYLLFEATVRPCRDRCRPARCAVDGREEPSFGRRRRALADSSSSNSTLDGNIELPDPADLRVEPQDEDVGPHLVDGADEEHVKRLFNVYYSRDEITSDRLTSGSGGSGSGVGEPPVCMPPAEYYAMVVALVLLVSFVFLSVLMTFWWYRRSRAIHYKNQQADMACAPPSAAPRSEGSSLFGRTAPALSSGVFRFLQARSGGMAGGFSSQTRRLDTPDTTSSRMKLGDPSEPIYTDPALFEKATNSRNTHDI